MGTNNFDVTEITLERHYKDSDPDTLTLLCQSISEHEAEYSYLTGADDSISRSLVEPHSLLVRGIRPEDLNALDAIEWAPTTISYANLQTRKPNTIHIGTYTQDHGILRFEVVDAEQ